MPELQAAKLLRIYLAEGDRSSGRSLYEVIVDKCRELQIAGVTVLRAGEGFGSGPEIHRARLLAHDRPIVIVIVDRAQSIERLVPVIEPLLPAGIITVTKVKMRRLLV